jgi:hypothetical protein
LKWDCAHDSELLASQIYEAHLPLTVLQNMQDFLPAFRDYVLDL